MLKVTKHTIDRLDLNRNHCLKKVYKEKGLGHKVYDQIPAKFQREEGEIKILKKSMLILLGQHNTISQTGKDGTRKV